MTRLQDDLLEVYNNLVDFSGDVLGENPCPISIEYDKKMDSLCFRCMGKSLYLRQLNYYIIRPDLIKPGYLLPEDYDILMDSLNIVIKAGILLNERVCVSPDYQGFDIYTLDTRNFSRGSQHNKSFKFISGNSKWFNWKTKRRFKKIL